MEYREQLSVKEVKIKATFDNAGEIVSRECQLKAVALTVMPQKTADLVGQKIADVINTSRDDEGKLAISDMTPALIHGRHLLKIKSARDGEDVEYIVPTFPTIKKIASTKCRNFLNIEFVFAFSHDEYNEVSHYLLDCMNEFVICEIAPAQLSLALNEKDDPDDEFDFQDI